MSARQYISGPPNMDPYAEQIDSGVISTTARAIIPEFRHRRRSPWRDVYESSILRGLAVAFVMVFCIGVGIVIARVTA